MNSATQENFLAGLANSISEDRLRPYRQGVDSEPRVYARYLWNTALCESLYPALNGLEIALRNSIHDAICQLVGKEFWFEDILVENGVEQFEEIKDRLSERNKLLTPGQIVSDSNFGFWTHLFNKAYESKGILWPALLQSVFPYAPAKIRTRKEFSRRLNKFRELRNRVFHYEPIWYRQDLPTTHQQIVEVVGWISPEKQSLVQLIDRFPAVHSQGIEHYQRLILAI